MFRIMVQGAENDSALEQPARELGKIVAKKKDWGFNLGAKGNLALWIPQGGASCMCHEVQSTGLLGKAPSLPTVERREHPSWGTRLDTFMTSDAFLFFTG